MSKTTPFIKRMRTQGGSFFCFASAMEDVGLNINERNNVVKMSHYALLNIPSINAPSNFENKFNVFAIPGAFESFQSSGNIKDGRVIVAESFQNYALNLETNLLSQTTYNPALQTTISERVFWKWLKETGAIRWTSIDTSAGKYWQEEIDSNNYNSIVKCIGQISAGSVRTDTFGTYNETYVLVPTSFGQTPVYFKQVEDDNYKHGLSITSGNANILGRETYLYPHPDALDFQAYYDLADSSTKVGTYTMQYDPSGGWSNGWWWTHEGLSTSDDNSYFIDTSSYITTGINNIDLQYYFGSDYIPFKRSKVDCLSVEYDLDKLKTIFGNQNLSFDDLAIQYAKNTSFDFNAVMIYYSVYNKALDKVLATNLLGILFLEPAVGSTINYPSDSSLNDIKIESITKLQSGSSGFGTSYSFRLNIKSDYMLDDTQAIVTDTTASQQVLTDFSQIFDNLSRTLAIMNQHTGTINYITEQYLDITSNQTNVLNQIANLQFQVNDITRDITGTENTIAMFADGDDPIVDSSIFMKNGKLGFFTNNPTYPAQFDVSLKVKDLIIENAVRDTSGNILIGYGSPLQLGSTTYNRPIIFYAGSINPYITIKDTSIRFHQTVIFDTSIMMSDGSPVGIGDVTKIYVDGSLAIRDIRLNTLDASLRNTRATYLPCASLGSGLSWSAGKIYVDVSIAAGGVTAAYVDGSFNTRDIIVSGITTSLNTFATNASIALAGFAKNASFGLYATNASINLAGFAKNSSVNTALSARDISIAWLNTNKADKGGAIGTVQLGVNSIAVTVSNIYDDNTYIATDQFVQRRIGPTDISLSTLTTRVTNHDTSIALLDSIKVSATSPIFLTSFGIGNWTFSLSGNDLLLKYLGDTLFKFTTDGSMLAKGEITAFEGL